MAGKKPVAAPPTRDMFGSVQESNSAAGPFFTVQPKAATTTRGAPPVGILAAFSASQARADSVYILRYLANSALRAAPVDAGAFLSHIGREIALKDGQYEAEILARDALITTKRRRR